jgi:membrane protein implicated in regulation of membrane protease activity
LLTGLRDLIFAIIGLSTFVVGSALALTLAFSATGSAGLALLAVLTWWLFCHVISERA